MPRCRHHPISRHYAPFGSAFLSITPSFAAATEKSAGPSESLFLLQIVIFVVLGRLLGEAMVRIGQPSIMGQIIAGLLLGPSLLGIIWPAAQTQLFPDSEAQKSMTDAVAQIGVLFLLLLAGMETDIALARRLGRSAAAISFSGIAIPFSLGFVLGELIPDTYLPDPDKRLVTACFLGTALSISSVKIVASVVREMDFMRRDIGQMIVASAIIDDTIGWVIIAVTFTLAKQGSVDIATLMQSVLGTLVFMAISFTIGRRAVFVIIRWTNDTFKSDLPVLSAIVAIMGVMALVTHLIGVHTVLGAFVAGVLVGESPILTRQIDTQLRGLTTALFMPVFFGLTGLHTDLRVLANPETLVLTVVVILIASAGKFGGAFMAAKLGGLSRAEALALGCGMNARGSTEVIVATIGLSVGVLDQRLFSVIVAMAIVTTMMMPPTLRWALARLPMRDEEKGRLQREEFEQTSFIANFERVLLAGDRSDSGLLAARLAGHLAALRAMPVTVLDIDAADAKEDDPDKNPAFLAEHVHESADRIVESLGKALELKKTDIHVINRPLEADATELLALDSEKGHDLLLAGLEPTTSPDGGFDKRLSRMSQAFKGTTVIASARGRLPQDDRDLRILVPVSGTNRSSRAAEFALMVAQATGCKIAAVVVTEPRQANARPRVSDATDNYRETFKRLDEIAGFYNVTIDKIRHEGTSPELSILTHARRQGFNLIVIGVSRREGEKLAYGSIAASLLESADRSIVFVETE